MYINIPVPLNTCLSPLPGQYEVRKCGRQRGALVRCDQISYHLFAKTCTYRACKACLATGSAPCVTRNRDQAWI